MNGQLSRAGAGSSGSATNAHAAPPSSISVVSISGSPPDFASTFQLACNSAPNSTTSMIEEDTGAASGVRHETVTRHRRVKPDDRPRLCSRSAEIYENLPAFDLHRKGLQILLDRRAQTLAGAHVELAGM